MIVVTGASGQLGKLIVEQLLKRVPAEQIGVSVRDPQRVALGVRVRQGDFAKPESLVSAFEGATQVLMVSSNAASYGGNTLQQHHDAIEAARTAGVQRIVYTSHMAASASSVFPPARDHFATEQLLRESGLEWTALRNGFYASGGLMFLGREGPNSEGPEDGKTSWTAHLDLAEAAAVVLTNEGLYEGPTPPLTGAEALDFNELAQLAGHKRTTISDDAYAAKLTTLPPAVVRIALSYYRAARQGEFSTVDPTLAQLIGRTPTSMRSLLAQAFKS